MADGSRSGSEVVDEAHLRQLAAAVRKRAPLDAVALLQGESEETIAAVLGRLEQTIAVRVLSRMPESLSERLARVLVAPAGDQWQLNLGYPDTTVGRLMEPPAPVLEADLPVREAIEQLRKISEEIQIVYAFAVDPRGLLQGVVTMRDLLFAAPDERLSNVMLSNPFFFRADESIESASQAAVHRHYPVYPVCDEAGQLLGLVRGYSLFEQRNFELTAQPGRMVGVEREEHVWTPWHRSLRLRHPWLQLNLLTALLAGAVVSLFEDTIAQAVVLAAVLPVLSGQSGNTGSQAMAVTLRGMILDEVGPAMARGILAKEALLGLFNGVLVGASASLVVLAYAFNTGAESPLILALVVLAAMTGSCVVSGVVGVVVPLGLRRLGADPATASAIFLTTVTDVVSMGLLLTMATVFLT